ncbi:hypothetical protein SEPCBS119000_005054 [Sporothrix epigloea]|uniref:J domain-containing protein n=1 Tax=Sporothrix epigloea TaxID=1892477 RepID=A0ABP0DVJ8_9PEZI
MSDSRRRSSRSSSTSHHRSSGTSGTSETFSSLSSSSTSSRHRSSRHSTASTSSTGASTAPSNRSSTSLHRISGSSHGRSTDSLTPSSAQASRTSLSFKSSSRHHGNTNTSPAAGLGSAQGLGTIYGNVGGRASESRFSLTDQFASTRSVLDFGFDDSASSIFDAESIFSVGADRTPSLYGHEAAASAAVITTGDGGIFFNPAAELGSVTPLARNGGVNLQGSPWQPEEEYLGGAYSTVLEENETEDDTATIGARDDDDCDSDLTDKMTPNSTPTRSKGRSRAPSSANVTVLNSGGTTGQPSKQHGSATVDDLQDPLQLPVSTTSSSEKGQRYSYGIAPEIPSVAAPPVHRTYYDLFCISRTQYPPPNGAQIRAAYYRLSRLLNSSISNGCGGVNTSTNLMPAALRPYAAAYFLEIQAAFETLIDPVRRHEYDRYLDDQDDDRTNGTDGEYDDDDSESDNGKASATEETNKIRTQAAYPLPHSPAFVRKHDFQMTTDLGARYTVSDIRQASLFPPRNPSVSSLDYSLTQTVQVGLPTLRRYTELGLHQLRCRMQRARCLLYERLGTRFTQRPTKRPPSDQQLWPIRCGIPIVSLSGTTYALSTAAVFAGTVPPLMDRYQPLLPEVLGLSRIAQLAHTRASGCIMLKYRQEFWANKTASSGPSNGLPPPPSAVVEIETQVFPRVAVTTRLSQTLALPLAVQNLERKLLTQPSNEPVYAEVMMQTAESPLFPTLSSSSLPPRFGLGLSRHIGKNGGKIFICADSGNNWWPLSSASSSLPLSLFFAPLISPMIEVGYSMSPHELGLHTGRPLTGPADRGLKGVDVDMDSLGNVAAYSSDRRRPVQPHGTWTVSTASSGYGSMAAYVRYGRTVFLTPLWRNAPAAVAKNTLKAQRQRQSPQRAVRIEAELCAADRYLSDGYLAVRALAPVRWWGFRNSWTSNATASFSSNTPASMKPPKIGLEVALSANSGNVHFSLYWSRLGQRIKLPFLLLPSPVSGSTKAVTGAAKLFAWATITPVVFMAVREVARIFWRSTTRRWNTLRATARAKKRGLSPAAAAAAAQEEITLASNDAAASLIDEEQEERAISRHRAEADELTMILASAVDAQRVLERELRKKSASAYDEGPESENSCRNKLIILSAKFGVALADDPSDLDHTRHDSVAAGLGSGQTANISALNTLASRNGWAPDYEVADVTAALSALVVTSGIGLDSADSDCLLIPAGLQKGRLLGFWDPAPGYRLKQRIGRCAPGKKVLHVRYLWDGLERIVEVGDREELRLP